MKQYFILVFSFFIVSSLFISCESLSPKKKKKISKTYKMALERAFSRMEQNEKGRGLASTSERPQEIKRLIPKLKSLSRDFEVIVFPKITGQAYKYPKRNFPKLKWSFPLIYRFQKRRIGKCASLTASKDRWRTQKYFTDSGSNQDCLVLEVKQTFPKIKRSHIRKDDQIAMRIYIDDALRPFGQEYEVARVGEARRTKGEIDIVGYKLDPLRPLDSGFTVYPVDLPNLLSPDAKKNWKKVSKGATKIPNHPFIKSQMKRLKVRHVMCQEGYKTHYKDFYGRKVQIGWCEGHAWPTTIETRRYFAVLRNGAESI